MFRILLSPQNNKLNKILSRTFVLSEIPLWKVHLHIQIIVGIQLRPKNVSLIFFPNLWFFKFLKVYLLSFFISLLLSRSLSHCYSFSLLSFQKILSLSIFLSNVSLFISVALSLSLFTRCLSVSVHLSLSLTHTLSLSPSPLYKVTPLLEDRETISASHLTSPQHILHQILHFH